MNERFVKIGNNVYYESELNLMSDDQLKNIISRCQNGIDEISIKKADYELENKEFIDSEHCVSVLKKFSQASCYLQSDIVLIERILRNRKESYVDLDKELEWYKQFFKNTSNCILKSRFNNIVSVTNEICGYSLDMEKK